MSGIIFYGTNELEKIKDFYMNRVGMELWLAQDDCIVLRHDNLLLGFCQREEVQGEGVITFFFRTPEEVDLIYPSLEDCATEEPNKVEQYRIYRFFATDPEGRKLEFQSFLHPVEPFRAGDSLLRLRRSVRGFEGRKVSDELLTKVFELCRFAPTSMNSESYYFVLIRSKEKMEQLAKLRGSSSAPIAAGPLAVAICASPRRSKRSVQDACIAAYHFLLACWQHGLGTCWIAAMDRPEVKELLNIPQDDYVATVTPVGFPARIPGAPERRGMESMVRTVE